MRNKLCLNSNKRVIKNLINILDRERKIKIKKASTKLKINKFADYIKLDYTINMVIEIEGTSIIFSEFYEAGEWYIKKNVVNGRYIGDRIGKDFFHTVIMTISNSDIKDKDDLLLKLLTAEDLW
jgi:hypothetical protein